MSRAHDEILTDLLTVTLILVRDRNRWRAEALAARATTIPPEQWRRLVQLCHPDRHSGSPAAQAATRWLLEVRP